MSETVKLKELVNRVKVGYVGPIDKYYCDKESGIKIYRPTDITPYGFDDSNVRYITKGFYKNNLKSQVHFGDVVISRCGKDGIPVIYKSHEPAQILNAVIIEPDYQKMSPEAIRLFLTSPQAQSQIENYTSGSVQAVINTEMIAALDVPVDMNLEMIQKYIQSLEDKIKNNKSISSALDSIAKFIYDYWFTQFEYPDENGKPYKSSGGKMVWNEELKRNIPEGWEVKPLSAFIASSKNGDWGNDTPKRKDDIAVTCFRGADFASITDDYHVTAPIRYIRAKNADRLLSDGDLVTEISGGSPTQATGRVGYINKIFLERNGGKMDCSNFCKAFTPVKFFYQYWLYQTWKAYYDSGVMFNYESKTTGIKNLMFDEFITWVRVPTPSDELLEKYQKVCAQYYDKIQEGFIESTQLASLRDFLLPMLMNGQVKIEGNS